MVFFPVSPILFNGTIQLILEEKTPLNGPSVTFTHSAAAGNERIVSDNETTVGSTGRLANSNESAVAFYRGAVAFTRGAVASNGRLALSNARTAASNERTVAASAAVLYLKVNAFFQQLFVTLFIEFEHFAGAALTFSFGVFIGFVENTKGHHFFVEIAPVYIAVE